MTALNLRTARRRIRHCDNVIASTDKTIAQLQPQLTLARTKRNAAIRQRAQWVQRMLDEGIDPSAV